MACEQSTMTVRLIVESGSSKTKVIPLRSPQTVVGRHKACGIRIPSASVSRRHCVLRYQNDCLTVEDLGSANGTYLNGQRISRKEIVRPRDRLEIGPLVLVAQYEMLASTVEYSAQGSPSVIKGTPIEEEDVAVAPIVLAEDEPGADLEIVQGIPVSEEAPSSQPPQEEKPLDPQSRSN
jgi:pSer/pThr/pTyr-binding forkhead associated (FHA) protein